MDEKIEVKLTKGNILRFLNVFFIIVFFLPTAMVSCSGQKLEISASKVTFGFTVMGEKIDGNPIGILMLIIPTICLVLLCLAATRVKKAIVAATMALNFANFAIWSSYLSAVKKQAKEAYSEFELTGWFTLFILFMLLYLIVAILCLIQKGQNSTSQMADNPKDAIAIQYGKKNSCPNCGAIANSGDTFCLKCGSKLRNTCPQCGADVQADSKFCEKCGAKVAD